MRGDGRRQRDPVDPGRLDRREVRGGNCRKKEHVGGRRGEADPAVEVSDGGGEKGI